MAFPCALSAAAAAICDRAEIHGRIRAIGDPAARHHSGISSGKTAHTSPRTLPRPCSIVIFALSSPWGRQSAKDFLTFPMPPPSSLRVPVPRVRILQRKCLPLPFPPVWVLHRTARAAEVPNRRQTRQVRCYALDSPKCLLQELQPGE